MSRSVYCLLSGRVSTLARETAGRAFHRRYSSTDRSEILRKLASIARALTPEDLERLVSANHPVGEGQAPRIANSTRNATRELLCALRAGFPVMKGTRALANTLERLEALREKIP